jgi:hypothetical protein
MPLVGIYQRDSAPSKPIIEVFSSRHILKAYYQDPSLGSFIKIHHWDLVTHLQESSTLRSEFNKTDNYCLLPWVTRTTFKMPRTLKTSTRLSSHLPLRKGYRSHRCRYAWTRGGGHYKVDHPGQACAVCKPPVNSSSNIELNILPISSSGFFSSELVISVISISCPGSDLDDHSPSISGILASCNLSSEHIVSLNTSSGRGLITSLHML